VRFRDNRLKNVFVLFDCHRLSLAHSGGDSPNLEDLLRKPGNSIHFNTRKVQRG